MPLTLADIERFTAMGHRLADFSVSDGDGWIRLRNRPDHRCHFLGEAGLCSIHDSKPEGCRLYPFILDEDTREVFRDSFCPFNAQFDPAPTTKDKVRELVGRLEREAGARLGAVRR
jgi:Fe-S-cluster containining protein